MFVISYKNNGQIERIVGTAETARMARMCVENDLGCEISPSEFHFNEQDEIVYELVDVESPHQRYVIEAVQHWS